MNPVKGSWWPVLDAAELGRKPVGRVRFGERLVFWRAASGVVCMPDRCPHRGAALSLGEVNPSGDALACPFHGLEFGSDGRCKLIPVEQDFAIPEDFGLPAYPVTEANGYTRLSQYLVFREDWPIVASQVPGDVLTATDEKLLPSDAPVLAYRKLHRSYY